jgi:hypothetical protein
VDGDKVAVQIRRERRQRKGDFDTRRRVEVVVKKRYEGLRGKCTGGIKRRRGRGGRMKRRGRKRREGEGFSWAL